VTEENRKKTGRKLEIAMRGTGAFDRDGKGT
jgi:hypothetical protein